jgi:hypothetical protein
MPTKEEIIAKCQAEYKALRPLELPAEPFEELSGLTVLTRERDHYLTRSIMAERHRQTLADHERLATIPGAVIPEAHADYLEKELLRLLRDHLYHIRSLLPKDKWVPDSEIEALVILEAAP